MDALADFTTSRSLMQDYPDYYELVETPMDLATLLSRVKRFHYRDHHEFLHDLALISK